MRAVKISNKDLLEAVKLVRARNEEFDRALREILKQSLPAINALAKQVTNAARRFEHSKVRGVALHLHTHDEMIADVDLKNYHTAFRTRAISLPPSKRKRGPKRNAIQRKKSQRLTFRSFVSNKAGSAYRVERWRRL